MKSFSHLASPEAKYALIAKILKLLKQYPATVLSLDADMDDGLALFAEHHQAYGIVPQKQYLADYKKALPAAKYYGQSLLSYRLAQKVQLTYLLDQKINTLIGPAKREKLFDKVLQHLEPYGVFIFDVYLEGHFADIQKHDTALSLKDTEVTISSWKEKKGIYAGKETSFVQVEGSELYERTDHVQSYQTFTLPQIKKLLAGFGEVRVVDWKGRKQNKKADHVVVVAQKGR